MEDTPIRKKISKMLGSYQTDYYSRQNEVKVLEWAEIYFELGKLQQQVSTLQNYTSYENRLRELENAPKPTVYHTPQTGTAYTTC